MRVRTYIVSIVVTIIGVLGIAEYRSRKPLMTVIPPTNPPPLQPPVALAEPIAAPIEAKFVTTVAESVTTMPPSPDLFLNLTQWRIRIAGVLILLAAFFWGRAMWMLPAYIDEQNFGIVPNSTFWHRYFIGVGLWIIALFILTRRRPHTEKLNPVHLATILAVVLIALAVRTYELGEIPYGVWIDEAGAGNETLHMIDDEDYRPMFVDGIHITGIHNYLFLLMAALFGQNEVIPLRLLSVFWGVGSVVLAYAAGKEIRGHWFGIFMALTLAVMRWSIIFSRIAMTGVDNHFFIILTIYTAIRFVKYGTLRDALALGISMGLGFWFYASYRLVIPVTALYVIIKWPYWKWEWRKPNLMLAATVSLTMLVLVGPILIFARENPTLYQWRSKFTLIFYEENREPGESVLDIIKINIPVYLEMFHFTGDGIGRHNLSRAPMLDAVTGLLFVVGLWYAFQKHHESTSWYFLLVFLVSLIMGIITMKLDAPQVNRTGGVVIPVAFCAALAIEGLGKLLRSWYVPRPVLYGLGAGIFLLMGYYNLEAYFVKQRYDYESWASHSTSEAMIAYEIKDQVAAGNTVMLSDHPPNMGGSPVIRFLVPNIDSLPLFDTRIDLPITDPKIPIDKGIALILMPQQDWMFGYIQLWYPDAKLKTAYLDAPNLRDYFATPELLYHLVNIPADNLQAIRGLTATGEGYLSIPASPEYHVYQFSKPILLDGNLIPADTTVSLYQGLHRIHDTSLEDRLMWRTNPDIEFSPIPSELFSHTDADVLRGLHTFYEYLGEDVNFFPTYLERLEFSLNYLLHPPVLAWPYQIIWEGYLEAPVTGNYLLQARSQWVADFSLNDTPLLTTSNDPIEWQTVEIALEAGQRYPLKIEYIDYPVSGYVDFYWQLPGESKPVPIPATAFYPFDH